MEDYPRSTPFAPQDDVFEPACERRGHIDVHHPATDERLDAPVVEGARAALRREHDKQCLLDRLLCGDLNLGALVFVIQDDLLIRTHSRHVPHSHSLRPLHPLIRRCGVASLALDAPLLVSHIAWPEVAAWFVRITRFAHEGMLLVLGVQ